MVALALSPIVHVYFLEIGAEGLVPVSGQGLNPFCAVG